MRLNVLLRVIGVVQLVLGLLYLLVPMPFLALMGSSVPQADIAYPLGMLAARFLAYGAGMFFIARAPEQQRFWINNMIMIQALDLAVGLFYTATGAVSLSSSGFPMFNASLFIILLTLWRPQPATPAGAGV
ncbi:hypothetical protein K2Z83_19130 [Oscillochloris sp. ZM17-4]|uniref:hypothetical protein n=1 Tax=Oscillochloris sp. ZM17-4 TaxID=2866714 RepID=UPI001C72AF0A|nr:hypothetical protein [Oscillochloris sp. ZM17-4]MBX0329787.1 hypothetical protein [Oscillochloris sp. ZM17-4]